MLAVGVPDRECFCWSASEERNGDGVIEKAMCGIYQAEYQISRIKWRF